MWVKPHQKSEKCSEFPRFLTDGHDNTISNFVQSGDCYGNPRNPDDTTVGHLDMNHYNKEFISKPLKNFFIQKDDHGNDRKSQGPNVECRFLEIILDLCYNFQFGEVRTLILLSMDVFL
jgi:hypothetical protein